LAAVGQDDQLVRDRAGLVVHDEGLWTTIILGTDERSSGGD
jgi:hypothetical protein